MTGSDFVQFIEYASTVVVPLAGGIEWTRRKYVKHVKPFVKKVEDIQRQFLPNGGSSMVDKVDSMNNKIDSFGTDLQLLSRAFNSTLYLDPSPIFKADAKGNFIFVNYAWLRLTGFTTQEDAFGTGWSKAVHPQDRFLVVDEWERAVVSQSLFNMDFRYQNIENQKITKASCRSTLIKGVDNAPVQYIGVINITEDTV